jgi:hypothetical protein
MCTNHEPLTNPVLPIFTLGVNHGARRRHLASQEVLDHDILRLAIADRIHAPMSSPASSEQDTPTDLALDVDGSVVRRSRVEKRTHKQDWGGRVGDVQWLWRIDHLCRPLGALKEAGIRHGDAAVIIPDLGNLSALSIRPLIIGFVGVRVWTAEHVGI